MQIHSLNVKVAEVVGVNKALLLQYIEFWVEKNRANNVGIYEGKAWVYHTANGFAQIFPYMKSNTIAKYLIELENDGYIVSMKNPDKSKNRNNQTKYYSLTQKYFDMVFAKRKIKMSLRKIKMSLRKIKMSLRKIKMSLRKIKIYIMILVN